MSQEISDSNIGSKQLNQQLRNLPVLVGVGQCVDNWDGKSGLESAPSPLSLATRASNLAISDAGLSPTTIDAIAVVRTMEDSTPFGHPFGKNENLPGTLAREISAKPHFAVYSDVGGQSPQKLINEFASRIFEGDFSCALISGTEAIRATKAAKKHEMQLDWADSADLDFEDRVPTERMLIRPEIKHGLVKAAYFYAMFENAMAAKNNHSKENHRRSMSELWAKFSQVAAGNPYAQFQEERSVDFLSSPSKANYPIADPYLKWHIAQDAVNQAASIVLMSSEKVDELGVDPTKRIYLHGAGEASEGMLAHRKYLDQSWAMKKAVSSALEQAEISADAISKFDLYSCFPCAVVSALEALGSDPELEERPLTVTGGLPFFGGPGNNYSMHAIASMVELLRKDRQEYGLVLANGGWMSKEAVGIYSAIAPKKFVHVEKAAKDGPEIELLSEGKRGVLESYTVIHGSSGPQSGVGFVRVDENSRFIAISDREALGRLCKNESPVGAVVSATNKDEVNTFSFV